MTVWLQLVRHDPAFRAISKIWPASLALGFLLRATPTVRSTLANQPLENPSPGITLLFLLILGCQLVWTFAGNSWTRSSRMGLALPLNPTKLWSARMFALIVLSWIPVIGLATPLVPYFSVSANQWMLHPLIVSAAFRSAATAACVLALLQLPWLSLAKIPIVPEYIAFGVLMIVVILPVASAGITLAWPTVALAVAALSIISWIIRSLPPSFVISPTEPDDPSTPVATSFADDPQGADTIDVQEHQWGNRILVPVVIQKALHWNVLTVSLLLCCFGFAMIVSEGFSEGRIIFIGPLLVLAWTLQIFQQGLGRCEPLTALPISRSTIFFHLTIPIVVAVFGGAGIGLVLHRGAEPITLSKQSIEPPWDYFEIVRIDEDPITVSAPWGETLEVPVIPLWRGCARGLVNPFATDTTSSPRFKDWQMSRAVRAVAGDSNTEVGAISAESSALQVNRPGHLGTGFGQRTWQSRSRLAATTFILFIILGTAVLTFYLLQFSRSRDRSIYQWIANGVLFFIAAGFGLAVMFDLAGVTELWRIGAVISIIIREAARYIGMSTSNLWLVAILLFVLSYTVLQHVFSHIEFPGKKVIQPFAEEY